MNTSKEIKKEDLISQLQDFNKEIRLENLKNQETHIDSLNEFITAYFNIFYKLNAPNSSKFIIYFQSYLGGIINNLIVIKELFISGYELQLQIMIRSQFEQMNVLLSILLDDKFFKQFTTYDTKKDDFMPLTPKQNHCKRILKKYFLQKLGKNEFNEWSERLEFLYDEFSKSTHGNLTQVMLLSRQEMKDTTNTTFAIAGSNNIKPRTTKILTEFNSYSVLIWLSLVEKLVELKYLNKSDFNKI